jgi:phosphatidate cytidylyltransferase
MLKQRILTAVVLLALLLPALLATPAWPFAAVSALAIGAAGWEWGRLNGFSGGGAVALGAAIALPALAAIAQGVLGGVPAWLWWGGVALWVLGGAWVLARGVARWPAVPTVLRCLLGALLLWLAWLALVEAKLRGVNFLLSVFLLVWAADIAAYFGGRAFGKRKLAPAISPGKSWEGVWSGMAGVLLLAAAWLAFDRATGQAVPSLYSLLHQRLGPLGLALAALFLVALSVVGDLFESLVKRSAGA